MVLQDNHQSPWKRAIYHKINRYGYSVECIQQMGYVKAKSNLRQCIIETERQQDLGIIINRLILDNALLPSPKPDNYLYLPLTPKHHKALTLAPEMKELISKMTADWNLTREQIQGLGDKLPEEGVVLSGKEGDKEDEGEEEGVVVVAEEC